MMAKKCFESGCMNEVEVSCKCSSPETLSCEVHIGKHLNLPDRAHSFESMFIQPFEGTKESILEFLAKESSKYSELRRKIRDSFGQCPLNLKRNLRGFTEKLDECLDEINDFFAKISQVKKLLKLEQDPILELLVLQPDEAVEKVKLMTIASKDLYNGARFFYIINEKLASLNRSFAREKCDSYLENMNIQNSPEAHNKINEIASIESANVKDSATLIINKNSENLEVLETIKPEIENEIRLSNSQISAVTSDINRKLEDIDDLRNKAAEILSRPNNPELEINFRTTCSAIQTNSSLYDPSVMLAYQEYLNAYQQKTSLYHLLEDDSITILYFYNTETETEETKILQTPELLNWGTCITQLPNGKLFCFGKYPLSGITVLIDENGGFEVLPSGTPCVRSSCIYFNNSVYCFGGFNKKKELTLSSRFDLDRSQWIQLAPMPKADYRCNSIMLNGDILISGMGNRNLLLYSIDIDSFSTIPYKFARNKTKILINAERIYLIESRYGSIYESEIGSCTNWRRIGKSYFDFHHEQVYCSYNKGGIYISQISSSAREYYFFDFDQKIIIDVACYDMHVSLRRVGKKIEAIKCDSQLDSYYLDECNLNSYALIELGKNLEGLEKIDKEIKLNPNIDSLYINKGNTFYDLKRYLEAIKCYDEAIKLNPNNAFWYNDKSRALHNLKRYLEEVECLDEAIKLNPSNPNFYYDKGYALNELGRYPEAVESYDKAIKINPYDAKFYNDKGNALYALERYHEAKQCHDEAIKLKLNNPSHFIIIGDLSQEEAASQDINRDYNMKRENEENDAFSEDEWDLYEQDIDLIGRDNI